MKQSTHQAQNIVMAIVFTHLMLWLAKKPESAIDIDGWVLVMSDTWRVTSTAYSWTSPQKDTAAGVALSAALWEGQGVSRRSRGGMRHIFSDWPPPAAAQAVKNPCIHG